MAELVGWLAATLTLITFSMRSMMALRLAAIGANLCFITYGLMGGLVPVLALHVLLLPCNLLRLVQLRRVEHARPIRLARAASVEDRSIWHFRAGLRAAGFALATALVLIPFSAASDPGRPVEKAPGGRGGVPVLLQAVHCSEDLLDCRDIEIIVPDFQAMEGCRNFLRGFWAHAALVGVTGGDRFVLRCRYDPTIVRRLDSGRR